MVNNDNLPSPFIVSVLENYYNEHPISVLIDLSKMPADSGYRRAVVDALNDKHKAVRVSYETFGNYPREAFVKNTKGVTLSGSVALDEDSMLEYDGYTVPEGWDDEDMASWEAEQAAKA